MSRTRVFETKSKTKDSLSPILWRVVIYWFLLKEGVLEDKWDESVRGVRTSLKRTVGRGTMSHLLLRSLKSFPQCYLPLLSSEKLFTLLQEIVGLPGPRCDYPSSYGVRPRMCLCKGSLLPNTTPLLPFWYSRGSPTSWYSGRLDPTPSRSEPPRRLYEP